MSDLFTTSTCSPVSPGSRLPRNGQTLWQTPNQEDAARAGSVEAWQEWEQDGRTTQCRLRNQIHASSPSPTPKSSHSPAPCTTGTSPNPSALAVSRTLHAIRFLSGQVLSRLTSLRAASHASRTPSPGNDSPAQTSETCGVSASECCGIYDPSMRCGKTSAAFLHPNQGFFSTEYVRTWPRAGMIVSGKLYQLPPLALPTDETECGLSQSWATANSRDWKDTITGKPPPSRMNHNEQTLGQQVFCMTSPAGRPDPASSNTSGSRQELWATPQASDPQHAGPNQRDSSGRPALPAQASKTQQGKLNPHWVATLMGYPAIWCELGRKFITVSSSLKATATPSSRSARPSSSNQS